MTTAHYLFGLRELVDVQFGCLQFLSQFIVLTSICLSSERESIAGRISVMTDALDFFFGQFLVNFFECMVQAENFSCELNGKRD